MTENGVTVTSEADDAMNRCVGWVGDVGGVSGCVCVDGWAVGWVDGRVGAGGVCVCTCIYVPAYILAL